MSRNVTRLLLRSVYATLLAASAMASSVSLSSIMQCPFKREWSSGSADLFNLAHAWSKSHDVENWTFSVQADNCSQADYESRIHLPDSFSLFWKPHSLKMRVNKHLCVHGRRMRETLVISNIPFVDSVVIRVFGSAHEETETVSLSAEYSLVVPWLLSMIDSPVQEHMRKSILEYLDVLKGDICAPSPGARAQTRRLGASSSSPPGSTS
jgi:hypothetical protein